MKKVLPSLLLFAILPICSSAQSNVNTVAEIPEMFCGWCANEGAWKWGNEILVGFVAKKFHDKGDIVDGHNTAEDAPEFHYFARSKNGGKSWRVETAPQFDDNTNSTVHPISYRQFSEGEGMNFRSPAFALRCRDNKFWYSHDKGLTWQGPVLLPRFDSEITSRTDYIVSGDSCFIFLSAKNRGQDRAFTVLATDRGRKMENLGWIAPLYLDSTIMPKHSSDIEIPFGNPTRSVMPSTVKSANGTFTTALRRKIATTSDVYYNWIDCYFSVDNCKTWQFGSFIDSTDNGTRNGNPPALAIAPNRQIIVCYGSRINPYGIKARVSNDNAKQWSNPITIRNDGRSWDLGYPRVVCLDNGKFLAMYYIATQNNRKQRIEASIIKTK